MADVNMATRQSSGLSIVQTESGLVSGADSDGVQVFKGIPFAAPPVGPLRWRPPQPPANWQGIRAATEFGMDCPQKRTAAESGSRAPGQDEDCLSLNVWTPARQADEKLPVMVWVYGGSFVFGSGSENRIDGETFARKGVVLVTVNYRVGLFGFLAHPGLTKESSDGFSGNYGLLDVLASLRWIRDNIAAFGGDPERVTLFGVSAGSAAVSLLMASPLAKGLFQQAILESPGTFRPLAGLAEAETAGRKLGEDIEALRRLSAAELLEKEHLLVPTMRGLTTPRVLRPIRDGHVIPEDERPAFNGGRFLAIPTIVGSNTDEGTSLTATWPVKTVADWQGVVRENFPRDIDEAQRQYPVTSDADVRRAVGDVFADTQFNYGVWGLARAVAKRQPKTYRYLFSRRRPGVASGPNHGEEVVYVFNHLDIPPRGQVEAVFDEIDQNVADAMQEAWVRFAASGDPNGPGLPRWPTYDAKADEVLEFGDEIRVTRDWRRSQVEFLDRFFEAGATG